MYITAAYASSEASQKIWSSDETIERSSGKRHLGTSIFVSNCRALNHPCHQWRSSPSIVSVQLSPFVPSSLSRILTFSINDEAVPSGLKTLAIRLMSSSRVKSNVYWWTTLKPRVSVLVLHIILKTFSSGSGIKEWTRGIGDFSVSTC